MARSSFFTHYAAQLLLLLLAVSRLTQARELPTHDDVRKKEITLFAGVQTGFNYRNRRNVLRETWFPSTQEDLKRLEQEQSIAMAFVIGWTDNGQQMKDLKDEATKHGGFLRIPYMESYKSLTRKTHTFFKTVLRLYNPAYILKLDDDVYLQLDRLSLLLPQYREMQADYIGCFFFNTKVIRNSTHFPQWVEPQHSLFGDRYPTYARGSAYMLSAHASKWLGMLPPKSLRYFRSEDVTMGMWMATFNVTHYEDLRLCTPECSPTSVVVYDPNGCTNCDPSQRMLSTHGNSTCHEPPQLLEGVGGGSGQQQRMIELVEPHTHFKRVNEDADVLEPES